jgi:multimeric flavodoxin WrbA
MRLLIHDLKENDFNSIFSNIKNDIKIISDNNSIHNCTGCFSCWVKTPGKCVIKDGYENMGELISKSDEVVIISRCNYGTYSPFVKNVLDRSLPYLLPYFEKREGETHHKSRYDKRIKFTVYFYGDDITEQEKETLKKLVVANGINMNAIKASTNFYPTLENLGEIQL